MKKPIYKRKWFIALIIILVLCIIGAFIPDNDDTESAEASKSTAEQSKASQEETQNEEKLKEETVKEEPVSQEFKNALSKAQSYSDTLHMSKAAIYDQLTSEYGENFPEDAAQYAIDNVDANWKENALKKAESYYTDMAMSKDAIYDQLISEYGEQFTKKQAQYAIDHLE